MISKEKGILSKFLADEKTSQEELLQLKAWLSDASEVESIFQEEWKKDDQKETKVHFNDILKKINDIEKEENEIPLYKRVLMNYQKVAAILLLPILAFSIYFAINQFNTEPTYFHTSAERGQKSQLSLPDGTKVWLNSDSEIIYSSNFGKKIRHVAVTGEAYFEVASNKKIPFVVEAGEAHIQVLGTSFNIKAYPDEEEIATTLVEGKVELTIQPEKMNVRSRTIEMRPGESLVYDKIKNQLHYYNFDTDEVLAWTDNQLIFRDDNFQNLVRKIERWYDVVIIYDEKILDNRRLTVELYQGELLFRLLDIIELALDVKCESENDKIYITEK